MIDEPTVLEFATDPPQSAENAPTSRQSAPIHTRRQDRPHLATSWPDQARNDHGAVSPTEVTASRRLSSFTDANATADSPSSQLERLVLASLMLDGAPTLGRCDLAGISEESFTDRRHALIFRAVRQLVEKGSPCEEAFVFQALSSSGHLEAAGGLAYLARVGRSVPTTAQSPFFIERLAEAARTRELSRILLRANDSLKDGNTADDALDYLRSQLDVVAGRSASASQDKWSSILDFQYPADSDPNILLGADDYLGRGGAMLFVSHAGAGKSSFIIQSCMAWALGRQWLGIRCRAPLRSLIVQAEDSSRYLGKVATSFTALQDITEADRSAIRDRVQIATVRGCSGEAFFRRLHRLVAQTNPDLVVINPMYIYADGDISKSEHAQPFLVGLDAVNRDQRFAYIVVHHTGKPQPKGRDGKRVELEDWETTYMGFGSSYFANWPRCTMLLEPAPGTDFPKRYLLKLGKAGLNAGVTEIVDHDGVQHVRPTTTIRLRHTSRRIVVSGRERPAVLWEVDENVVSSKVDARAPIRKGGRPAKHTFEEFLPALREHCSGYDSRKSFSVLHRAAAVLKPISAPSFSDLLSRAVDRGELIKTPQGYYLPEPVSRSETPNRR